MSLFKICIQNEDEPSGCECHDVPDANHSPVPWDAYQVWVKDLSALQQIDGIVSTLADDNLRLGLHDTIRSAARALVHAQAPQATLRISRDVMRR